MYTITCYSTAKRKNSTKQVDGEGTTLSVNLKNGASVISPTFYLNAEEFPYNYLEWNGRKYWVNNVYWGRNNLCTLSCEVDVLGTWKNDILNTSAYVNYSSSNFNTDVIDTRLMVSNRPEIITSSVPMGGSINSTGEYVLGVIGNREDAIGNGFVSIYGVEQAEMADISRSFNDPTITEQIQYQFGNAFGCLVFCKWLPVKIAGPHLATIRIGNSPVAGFGQTISARIESNTVYLPIDWPADDFRRAEPFCQLSIYLPFVGVVDVSLSDVSDITTLSVAWRLDYITGEIVYSLINSTGNIGIWKGNAGVDLPITAYQNNILGAMDSAVNGVISASGIAMQTTGDALTGNLSGVAGGMTSFFTTVTQAAYSTARNYFTKTASINGGFSGACGVNLGTNITAMLKYWPVSDSPENMATVQGRPCGRTLSIAGLSGYVQCADFHVKSTCTAFEKNAIENHMKSGVYIE